MADNPLFDAVRARPTAAGSPHRAWLLAALAIVVALAGCGGAGADLSARQGSSAASAESSPVVSDSPSPTRAIKVFFVKGEQFAPRVRTVPPGEATATVAMKALLAGPTASERRSGIDTTLPARTKLASVDVRAGTATVELRHTHAASTAFDISLRPARAAQVVYTLTALPGVKRVLIRVNGMDRATVIGSKLAFKGPLDKHDLSRAIPLPAKPGQVPTGPAPADARGVQSRLVALGYLPSDAVTGAWDARTSQAVIAFQAWHQLDRDAIVGPQTLAALENAARPRPTRTIGGRHVEVYRDKGVTLLIEGAKVVRALHSSSGAQGYETPPGTYSIFRKEKNSWSVPYQVWLPYASYFNAGIAFHAYRDVPAHPASHGCIRLPVAEAGFAYDFMSIGTPVTVY